MPCLLYKLLLPFYGALAFSRLRTAEDCKLPTSYLTQLDKLSKYLMFRHKIAHGLPAIAPWAGKYRVGDKVYFSDPDKRGLDGPYLISYARNGKYQLSLEDGTSVNEAKYVLEKQLITAEA